METGEIKFNLVNSDHQCVAILQHDGQGHDSRIARLLLQGLQPGIHFQFIARTMHQSSHSAFCRRIKITCSLFCIDTTVTFLFVIQFNFF